MNREDLDKNFALHESLRWAKESRESLRRKAGVQSPNLDGMPHGTGVSDKTGNFAVLMADLSTTIDCLEKEVALNDSRIREFSNSLKDVRLQVAIPLRFIQCLSWAEVADILGYGVSEDTIRKLYYATVPRGDL